MLKDDAPLLKAEEEKLLACVHCGFCLSVCPTYTRLGSEAESPRGRLHLMRAVAEGRVHPASPAFAAHLDACLGCRACETACPVEVDYGFLLERARATVVQHRGMGSITRLLLWVFGSVGLTRAFGFLTRLVRRIPGRPRPGRPAPKGLVDRLRFGLAMAAGSIPTTALRGGPPGSGSDPATKQQHPSLIPTDHAPLDSARDERGVPAEPGVPPGERGVPGSGPSVALLEGCVQSALFGHVNQATARVLEANGCQLKAANGQKCCGALHSHAGDLEGARRLASENLTAFEGSGAELIVTNSAGCGAALKAYPALFDDPALKARAAAFSAKVRDVNELLATLGPRPGAPVPVRAAWDCPCHLQHGQGLAAAPLKVLKAVPGLQLVPVARADECCGGAGIYALLHPELGGRILADKVNAVTATNSQLVITANPGCMMQLAAGLRWYGVDQPVLHAIELLDESYRRAGWYGPEQD